MPRGPSPVPPEKLGPLHCWLLHWGLSLPLLPCKPALSPPVLGGLEAPPVQQGPSLPTWPQLGDLSCPTELLDQLPLPGQFRGGTDGRTPALSCPSLSPASQGAALHVRSCPAAVGQVPTSASFSQLCPIPRTAQKVQGWARRRVGPASQKEPRDPVPSLHQDGISGSRHIRGPGS